MVIHTCAHPYSTVRIPACDDANSIPRNREKRTVQYSIASYHSRQLGVQIIRCMLDTVQ